MHKHESRHVVCCGRHLFTVPRKRAPRPRGRSAKPKGLVIESGVSLPGSLAAEEARRRYDYRQPLRSWSMVMRCVVPFSVAALLLAACSEATSPDTGLAPGDG